MGDILLALVLNTPWVMILPLIFGWILDRILGDPVWLSHPVVLFGNIIAWGEKRFNKPTAIKENREKDNNKTIDVASHHNQFAENKYDYSLKNNKLYGAIFAVILILFVFVCSHNLIYLVQLIDENLTYVVLSILVFYCLAGTSLIAEVQAVFMAADHSLEAGREQVARIVGRDTSQLDVQQIRTAALETLAENLSDGVVAPLFWYMLLGVPGMLAYKMINTLDSMIGYKSDRYKQFGCWAARIDDIANYIPARITAVLMLLVSNCYTGFKFVKQYGKKHASPNSGYPESALAAILDCRFGGPNVYFDRVVDKPYIGDNNRELNTYDMEVACRVNKRVENVMLVIALIVVYIIYN